MATCKDCFHFEVCDSGRHIGEYELDDGVYSEGVENECLTFKPTADVVEVKHGEYGYSSTDDKWHCLECFAERPRNNGDIPYSDIYYCYKCGAKMDGKDTNIPTK